MPWASCHGRFPGSRYIFQWRNQGLRYSVHTMNILCSWGLTPGQDSGHPCLNVPEGIATSWWPLCWESAKVLLATSYFAILFTPSPLPYPFQLVTNSLTTKIMSYSSFFWTSFSKCTTQWRQYIHDVQPLLLSPKLFHHSKQKLRNH